MFSAFVQLYCGLEVLTAPVANLIGTISLVFPSQSLRSNCRGFRKRRDFFCEIDDDWNGGLRIKTTGHWLRCCRRVGSRRTCDLHFLQGNGIRQQERIVDRRGRRIRSEPSSGQVFGFANGANPSVRGPLQGESARKFRARFGDALATLETIRIFKVSRKNALVQVERCTIVMIPEEIPARGWTILFLINDAEKIRKGNDRC